MIEREDRDLHRSTIIDLDYGKVNKFLKFKFNMFDFDLKTLI